MDAGRIVRVTVKRNRRKSGHKKVDSSRQEEGKQTQNLHRLKQAAFNWHMFGSNAFAELIDTTQETPGPMCAV
jgi:hypothetical protein